MDPQLKQLMKELGDAINESIAESKLIAEVVSRIKAAGYDIFPNLEATIGASKRGERSPAPDKTLEWKPPQIRSQDDTPDRV